MSTHGNADSDCDSRLKEIAGRVNAASEDSASETKDQVVKDRAVLLSFVRAQAAQLKAVRHLAETSVHRISVDDLIAALEQTAEEDD